MLFDNMLRRGIKKNKMICFDVNNNNERENKDRNKNDNGIEANVEFEVEFEKEGDNGGNRKSGKKLFSDLSDNTNCSYSDT